jgi:type IV pilus assembly protein PilV
LIEVLVTVVVMSVGLLGVAGIQLTSLKNNDSAYIRSKSAIYAYNLIDYMRANRNSAIAGDYNVGLSALSDLTAPTGTPTIAETDRYNWFQHLDNNLPSAQAAINCDATAVCVVKVEWDDSHAEGSTSTKHIVLTAQL